MKILTRRNKQYNIISKYLAERERETEREREREITKEEQPERNRKGSDTPLPRKTD